MSFANDAQAKEAIVNKYQLHDSDTGSPEVQIALLTERINNLAEHFNKFPQDKHSKRGLLTAVSKRKKQLSYLKNEDIQRYRSALDKFNIRK